MFRSLDVLGEYIKNIRISLNLTQEQLQKKIGSPVNRSHIAHLEQGARLPKAEILQKICNELKIHDFVWKDFLNEKARLRAEFEAQLAELVGVSASSLNLDSTTIEVVEKQIQELFENDFNEEQTFENLRRILVSYGVSPMSSEFFKKYLGPDAFKSIETLSNHIKEYQKDAIRLFSTLGEAYERLNANDQLSKLLEPLKPKTDATYRDRRDWRDIQVLEETSLSYLGYIAAERVKQEQDERHELAAFLIELAEKKISVESTSEKKKRKIDTLLRKFESRIEHGLFSQLFRPDADVLLRESKRLAPKESTDIQRMEDTQKIAYQNLSNYLTSDYMDVYVATSMRSDSDFISVNRFVTTLFDHESIRPLKLRYFNPTQSWIEDRVAKGLVEALMLKRADFCIYMAQKADTFGKDSEASVSLGQGKPVIVYVPKLFVPETEIDMEILGFKTDKELIDLIKKYGGSSEDEEEGKVDSEALLGELLTLMLSKIDSNQLIAAIKLNWADFDLYGEIESRITDESRRKECKEWLDKIIRSSEDSSPTQIVTDTVISVLIGAGIRFEKRAKVFREVHPLALQVILSTGVLNGILVARSIQGCAYLLRALVNNKLELELAIDESNYRLIEKTTKSTIRVISRHKLIANSFGTFYSMHVQDK
jgi:DNA-binding XRE family transcriptional regulator